MREADGSEDGLTQKFDEITHDPMASMYAPVQGMFDELQFGPPSPCCKSHNERMGAYLRVLAIAESLPPFKLRTTENPLKKLEMSLLQPDILESISSVKACKKKCWRCEIDFLAMIHVAIGSLRGKVGYLCLQCMRENKYEMYSRSCTTHRV